MDNILECCDGSIISPSLLPCHMTQNGMYAALSVVPNTHIKRNAYRCSMKKEQKPRPTWNTLLCSSEENIDISYSLGW